MKYGYTVALPMPMDMPFLLRVALEGLAAIDTSNCKQILIVPDGWGNDGGAALKDVMRDFRDPRLQIIDLKWLDYRAIRYYGSLNFAHTHWLAAVNATKNSEHEYVFLHDADAFFLEKDGLESQFAEIQKRDLSVLGVTARWDPFFTKVDATIAGTWELMYSVDWAHERSPIAWMPGTRPTSFGDHAFDSMLYSQFLDRDRGNVGIMERPTSFVHFNGTICTYRAFRDRNGHPVVDELFRILLLSLIESALEIPTQLRTTPTPAVLALGLVDANASVRYDQEINKRGYPEFRSMLTLLLNSPAFIGRRAAKIESDCVPFDLHFSGRSRNDAGPAITPGKERRHGLGGLSQNC